MKKTAIFLAIASVALISGCSGRHDALASVNKNKTQLYVGVYDGDCGTDSTYALAKRFEEKYKDVSFEEGKTGVEVKITQGKYSNSIEDTMSDMTEEVFIGTAANANYLAKKGLLADISDVYLRPLNYDFVTGKTDPDGETITLRDKLRDNLKDQYLSEDGKYYGYPGATSFYGLVYDVDMFETYNLYFAKNGGFVSSATDERSAGPDGDFSTTYDNGLPATYDDFFTLCDKIVSLEMTPVMWGGTVQEYVNSLLTALAADNDGKEQTELNYGYDGNASTLISSFSGDTPVLDTAPTAITAANGYELYRQEGRYYALRFLERLTSDTSYYNSADATNPSFGYSDAQDIYLLSKYSTSRRRTAMLVEGTWWSAGARGTFLDMSAENPEDSAENRRFAILPLPKATSAKVGEKFTVLERCVGDGFVSKYIEDYKLNLAKSFVQFMYTDESCVEYLQINSLCMPVSFDVGDAYDALTPWAKNMYDVNRNAVVATMYSTSKIMQNYSADLWYSPNLWISKTGGSTYTYPSYAMIKNHITAKDYFIGLQDYWSATTWAQKFSDI